MYEGISVDKTFNQSTSSSSSCLHEMINFIVSIISIIMTWTCKITLKCILQFKILQLIQYIVETDNNDVCVRDVETQMQKVHFRIADMQKHVHLKFSAKMTTESFAVKNKYFKWINAYWWSLLTTAQMTFRKDRTYWTLPNLYWY